MAQPINTSPKKSQKLIFGLLLLFILLVAIVGFLIFRHPSVKDKSPLVGINSPENGVLVELNQPIKVIAQAENSPGIKRVEVYADGALIITQDSTLEKGANPLILNQNWTPLSIGRHALVARGYDINGKFSDSSIVYVDVVDLLTPNKTINVDSIDHGSQITSPSLAQLADAAGVTVDTLGAANPSLSGTDPSAPLPPGTELTVPRNPAPAPTETGAAPAPMTGLPVAPTNINGTITCTTAQITWAASPDAANGYVVYRLGPGDVSPQRVGTVAQGVTRFNETISNPGTYRYQVGAIRNGMEGLSVYFTSTMPDSCTPAPTSPDVVQLVLNVTGITTNQPYDGLYCYFSFDQGPHLRIPAGDFNSLLPDSTGMNFELQSQLPNRGVFVLEHHNASQPVSLVGECWGRQGVASLDLGSFSLSLAPSDWNGADKQSNAMQSAKVASASNGPLTLVSFSLHYRIGYESTSTLRAFVPSYFGNVTDEELRPVFQLEPSLLKPYDLSSDFGGNPVRCTPSSTGIICRASSGLNLSWKYDGNRNDIGGFGYSIENSPGEFAASFLVNPPEILGSTIYYGTTSADAQAVSISDINAVSDIENLMAQVCGTDARIGYTIYVLDKHGGRLSSTQSFIPAPVCDTQVARVEVTLNSVTFGPSSAHHAILDNDTCIFCTDNRIEMIGYAGLTTGGISSGDASTYWQGSISRADAFTTFMEFPIWQAQGIAGDVCGSAAAACAYGPSASTTFQWADLELKNSSGLSQNHNVLSVNVRDGHTVSLQIEVYDIPTGIGGADEPLCVATITFPSNNAAEWKSVNEQQTINQDHGEASCQITYTVKGSTP